MSIKKWLILFFSLGDQDQDISKDPQHCFALHPTYEKVTSCYVKVTLR